MSFPIVNGTLIDTAEDVNSRPIAMSSGLLSGLAKAMIFLNEEVFCGVLAATEAGRSRDKSDFFGVDDDGVLVAGVDEEDALELGLDDVGCVELNRRVGQHIESLEGCLRIFSSILYCVLRGTEVVVPDKTWYPRTGDGLA